jgi:hypothetical protein
LTGCLRADGFGAGQGVVISADTEGVMGG